MRRGRADTRNGCWSLPRTAPLLPLGPVLFPAVGEVRLVLIDYFFFFFSRMERCFFFTRLEGKSHNPTKYNNNNTENPLKHLFFKKSPGTLRRRGLERRGGGWCASPHASPGRAPEGSEGGRARGVGGCVGVGVTSPAASPMVARERGAGSQWEAGRVREWH